MSNELFEVAFSGEIAAGVDLAQVKAKVGAMFKADEKKLAQLFSGKRVVIKKNIDQATASKYQAALNKAGALCEVKSLSASAAVEKKSPAPAKPKPAATAAQPKAGTTPGDIPPAPQTAPLDISGDQIADLGAAIAPVGSDMQDEIKDVPEPQLDISGLNMAPAGTALEDEKNEETPPPPDTSGLSLVDS